MLIFDFDGREATPLRAVRFLTHGLVTDMALMQNLAKDNWPVCWPSLEAFRVLNGELSPVHPGMFLSSLRAVLDADAAGDTAAAASAVPAGVYVWLDGLRALHSSLEIEVAIGMAGDDGRIRRAGGWHEDPLMTAEQRDFVLTDTGNAAPTDTASGRKLDKKGNDPVVQKRANESAAAMARSGVARVTKKMVAAKLSEQLNQKSETLMRRFDKAWK